MSTYIELEHCNVEDPLLVHEIKTEPVDIKSEVKTEAEECDDIEHHVYPIAELFPSIEIKSKDIKNEVMTEEEECHHIDVKQEITSSFSPTPKENCMQEILLKVYEKELENGEKNSEEDETNLPVVHDSFKIVETDLHEKCVHECDVIAEEMNTSSVYKNLVFLQDIPSMCKQIECESDDFNICNKNLSAERDVTENMYEFLNEKHFIHNSLNQDYNIIGSTRIHMNDEQFTYDISCQTSCDKAQQTTIQNRIKLIVCTICSKSFSDKNKFTRHKRLHVSPFTCKFCSKSFAEKFILTRHLRTHTNEKPFICNFCSKSFAQTSHLSRHLRYHTNDKPFICNLCKKSFYQKADLNKHLIIHTNEKPFTCNICRQSFTQKYSLVIHIRKHTNEKPYACSVCRKSFPQKCTLIRHTRTHTHEKPFTCDICTKSFSRKSHLVSHVRAHKNNNM